MTDPVKELRLLAQARGIQIKECGAQHFQILGPLLVNYYPYSAKRTAYVAGTKAGKQNVTPQEAIVMSLQPPAFIGTGKRANMRKVKLKMLARTKDPRCKWCGCELTEETATVDHYVPLALGGLDHPNNRVLACQPCNAARGHAMPDVLAAATALQETQKEPPFATNGD